MKLWGRVYYSEINWTNSCLTEHISPLDEEENICLTGFKRFAALFLDPQINPASGAVTDQVTCRGKNQAASEQTRGRSVSFVLLLSSVNLVCVQSKLKLSETFTVAEETDEISSSLGEVIIQCRTNPTPALKIWRRCVTRSNVW